MFYMYIYTNIFIMRSLLIPIILLSLQANGQYKFNKLNLAATAKDTTTGFHADWFQSFGNKIIFSGTDDIPSLTLAPYKSSPYLSDGSTSGTTVITPLANNVKIKKIIGTLSTVSYTHLDVYKRQAPNMYMHCSKEFLVFKDKLYFTGGLYRQDTISSCELWVTEGTDAGTKLVIDLDRNNGSTPSYLTSVSYTHLDVYKRQA